MNPFAGIMEECSGELEAHFKSIPYPAAEQPSIFPGFANFYHVEMGLFYELLTVVLFGGKLIDAIKESACELCFGSNKPDVVSEKRKVCYESKANRSGHQLNILKSQFDRYCLTQLLHQDYKINYCIYRHTTKNIKSYQGSRMELFSELATTTTKALLVLPLQVIWDMFHCEKFKYYKNEAWGECRRIPSTFINSLIRNPYPGLEHIANDDNLYRYKSELKKSPVVKIDGFEVVQFPVRIITAIDSELFLEMLNEPPF